VTSQVQSKDSSYQYCHVLGHELSAQEVAKDPSQWKDVVSRCPSGLCSNGCIHGGFQERFRGQAFTESDVVKLLPDLKTICEDRPSWHPTGLEQASCYHALGHLVMYIENGEVNPSLPVCDQIAKKSDGRDFVHLCYDGVFMQIYQPLEPEDQLLVEGKQPTVETFSAYCNKYTGQARGSCISEAWPLFRDKIQTPAGLVAHCGLENAQERDRCFDGLEYVLTAQFNFDEKRVEDFCRGLPIERSGQCFANGAGRLIETDYRNISKSAALCAAGEPFDPNSQCYQTLLRFSTYNFHPGSTESLSLCRSLPNPWQIQCLNKQG
jgi:hypothetical protein